APPRRCRPQRAEAAGSAWTDSSARRRERRRARAMRKRAHVPHDRSESVSRCTLSGQACAEIRQRGIVAGALLPGDNPARTLPNRFAPAVPDLPEPPCNRPRFAPEQMTRLGEVPFYGVPYVIPTVETWPGTILAVNVGGAIIPVLLSLVLIVKNNLYKNAIWGVLVVSLACYLLAEPVPGLGI